MNLGFELKLSQEQKLVMTMQMQQSIKILQMSSYELNEYIEKELEENIVLDKDDSFDRDIIKYKEIIKNLGENNYSDNYFPSNEKDEVSPFNLISEKKTLKDYLKEQVTYSSINKNDQLICKYIIDNLDDRGYLEENIIEELMMDLQIDREKAERCLKFVQSLEPIGIGCRTLSECLNIQLSKKGYNDTILKELIDKYLIELSQGKYRLLSEKLKISIKQVQEYEDLIKTLEPKPSRGYFTGEAIGYIFPDVYIKKIDEDFVVITNENLFPNLKVNGIYKDVINQSHDKEAIKYVKEKIESALYLVKSIESRKNTICRVVEEIIKYQKEYFEGKEKNLKPMTIKNIANSLEMHESTISRAVKDKYVVMHTGEIKKIKDFFANYVNVSNNEISAEYVKTIIKDTIDKENKLKPLSDEKICNILSEKGIEISRRTIAKYRDEMNIKSSAQRKRVV